MDLIGTKETLKIEIPTDAYNPNRYSTPWIAKVDFSKTVKGEFLFGGWCGDWRNGSHGFLSVKAMPGDIIAHGQKDYRRTRNSVINYAIVKDDGSWEYLESKVGAYRRWNDEQA